VIGLVRTPNYQQALLPCAGSRDHPIRNPVQPDQPRDRHADDVSDVLLSAQQGQGIAEALFEEVIGELSVRQSAGEL
jgi:hypothetical protein